MALKPRIQSRNVWWIVAGVVGVALLALGSFLFVNSFTTGRALDDAEALREADLTLAAHDVAVKSIGQLILFAEDAAFQLATDTDVEAAAVEAQRTVDEVKARFERLESGVREELTPAFDTWYTSAQAVSAQAVSGNTQEAAAGLTGSLAPASDRFVAELTAERDSRASAVADATDSASSIARLFGFLTIFLIPLLAILAYWFTARRQLQEAATHLDARIDAEKSLGRGKDEFIASVSEELRTPVASIYGFSEELLERGFIDPRAGDLVGLINQESAELARMAEDLLVAAHDETAPLPLDYETLNMEEQIQEVVDPFRRRGHPISGTWGKGSVRADGPRVRQILRNLVANAVQHGGPDIRIYGDSAGSRYVVSVEDNGQGVPREIVDKLFNRVVRGQETPLTAGSIGLGLAVAQSLAEAMAGSLDYERVANRTAFVLSLPLLPGAGPSEPGSAEQ